MDLEAILMLFDQYSLALLFFLIVSESRVWLDGGLILCPCLYNSLHI
jgi:hypothetical protein